MSYHSNPTSKAELVDRLLSPDFTGDLREVAKDPRQVKIRRVKPHVVSLAIAGKEFLLAVHKPKPEEAKEAYRKAYLKRMSEGANKKGHGVVAPKAVKRGGSGRYD